MRYVVYGIRYKEDDEIRFTSPQCADSPEEAMERFRQRVYDVSEFRIDGAKPRL